MNKNGREQCPERMERKRRDRETERKKYLLQLLSVVTRRSFDQMRRDATSVDDPGVCC